MIKARTAKFQIGQIVRHRIFSFRGVIYVAYVSEQNLLADESGEPIRHSQVAEIFVKDKSGSYRPRNPSLN